MEITKTTKYLGTTEIEGFSLKHSYSVVDGALVNGVITTVYRTVENEGSESLGAIVTPSGHIGTIYSKDYENLTINLSPLIADDVSLILEQVKLDMVSIFTTEF